MSATAIWKESSLSERYICSLLVSSSKTKLTIVQRSLTLGIVQTINCIPQKMERIGVNNSTIAALTLQHVNGSVHDVLKPSSWVFLSIFSLVIFIFSLVTNGAVLAVFAKSTWLCTPFNVYLINLLAANLLSMLIQVPNYLVNSLHGSWFTGSKTCSLYIFGFVFQAGMWPLLLQIFTHDRQLGQTGCEYRWWLLSLSSLNLFLAKVLLTEFFNSFLKVWGLQVSYSRSISEQKVYNSCLIQMLSKQSYFRKWNAKKGR